MPKSVKKEKSRFENRSLEAVARDDRKIARSSFLQAAVVLIASFIMLFAKPSTAFGRRVIAQNLYLRQHVFTTPVIFLVEGFLILLAAVYLYKGFTSRYIKKQYLSGSLLMVIIVTICILSNSDRFLTYSYTLITAIALGILGILKYRDLLALEKEYIQWKQENDPDPVQVKRPVEKSEKVKTEKAKAEEKSEEKSEKKSEEKSEDVSGN